MKAISIKQPFTFMICDGLKSLEIRSRKTNYRGKLIICSSQSIHDGLCLPNEEIEFRSAKKYYKQLTNLYMIPSFRVGHAICIVDLVNCRKMENTLEDKLAARHEYVKDAYVYEFQNVHRFNPFPVRGQLGIFNVDVPDYLLAIV